MKLANYIEVRSWLEGFIPLVYGKEELGLARIENLLKKLGNPQKKFKSIHVAGTSGKGSTAFYIARLLQFAGPVARSSHPTSSVRIKSVDIQIPNPDLWALDGTPSARATRKIKIGLHVSPHLVDIRERMQIFDNKKQETRNKKQKEDNAISVKRLVSLVNEIKPVVEAIGVSQPELLPSYFEILVAMSFLYFAQEKVDWAVVEVGLGGRLDATNVLQPLIAVITNIGLDHTEILGNTIEKIAFEKAGIIKTKVPVVTGAKGKALDIIIKEAKSKNAKLINIYTHNGKLNPTIESYLSDNVPFDLFSYDLYSAKRECILLAVLGVLQLVTNVDGLIFKSLIESQFPGRFEVIDKGVILDGAHNADKIKALIEMVKAKLTDYRLQTTAVDGKLSTVVLVVAFKKGKDWKGMLDMLIKNLPIERIIATEYMATTDTGRGSSVDAREIAEYLTKDKRLTTNAIKNSQEAVINALSKWKEGGLVLVTGSLYLVGEARTMWELPNF